ncbi:MAG TPA: insulinase family protein [Myxococcales bacterium]|nr:insulinase family protein [Myxococcales bacterium]
MKRLCLLALLVACAGSQKETASAARSGAAPAETQPAPVLAAAPGAADAGVAAQPGAPAQPGKEAQKHGQEGATPPPASATAQAQPGGEAHPSAPEPPLMPDAPFRAQAPAPLAVQPHFQPPVPVQRKLKNGARVLIVENHSVPLVAVDVRFLHGVDADPGGKPGLAEFVADTVDEGTKSRPAAKLAEEIEDLAASLGAGASLETSSVHLNCLTETLPKALELLADVVQNPAFRAEDVERVRLLKLTALEQKKASTGALAADEAARILYGPSHPWGQPAGGTPEAVAAITPQDLAAFHDTWWVPNNAIISVSGDVKPAQMVQLLEAAFASWKRRPLPRLSLPPFPALSRRSIEVREKGGTTQSQVWVVGRMFKATSPDAVPMRVANLTLGGLFTSRLNLNLREKHGYSYGVSSSISLLRDSGTFAARGGIVAKNTVEAVSEYEKELKTFSNGKVSDAELAAAKEALVRGLPAALETNDAVSGAMGNLVSLRLPLDYYRTFAAKVGKVTQKDVQRVVTKWVKPDRWPVVIVGPVGQSKEALEKLNLGPVSVSPAVPAPKPSAARP